MLLKEFLYNNRFTSKIVSHYINYRIAIKQRLNNKQELDKLKSFKNIHLGERCFIIGTGPSLTAKDLDTLKKHNEVSFGSNRIYEVFNQTDWRPTYYANQDYQLINNTADLIKTIECKQKFLPIDVKSVFKTENDISYFVLKHKEFYPKDAEFSFDITKYIGQGFTVTYGLIQIAKYMGFSKIYLLGIDHNYSISLNEKGVPVYNDTKDYFEGAKATNQGINLPRVVESTVAYMTAEKIARKNNFKIFNATRGGKLESFERVNFDDLFDE